MIFSGITFLLLIVASSASGFGLNGYGKYNIPKYKTLDCNCRVLKEPLDAKKSEPSTTTVVPATTKKEPQVVVVHKTEMKPKAFSLPRFLAYITKTAFSSDRFWQRDHVFSENVAFGAGSLSKSISFLNRLDCSCEGNAMDVLKAERFLRLSVIHA
ncbi:hypothetical protein QR680_019030 [Steinernema hermaphroditum]|uniref:Uncharacterized protein n=1 Tax=Steinernema hermaphroditum TaxID=289476 RepID=A0AA39HKQ8_9BILA|nr:hypothetical protein QR680_019030 [Steinernema hermaphroditum]